MSMCSSMPKPKLPVSEKFSVLSSYSLTFRPRSRMSSAFWPRTVTWAAIFSLRRMPKPRTVYRAAVMTGSCLVRSFSMRVACVRRSPDSPTLQFSTTFSTRMARMSPAGCEAGGACPVHAY